VVSTSVVVVSLEVVSTRVLVAYLVVLYVRIVIVGSEKIVYNKPICIVPIAPSHFKLMPTYFLN
jgi:hypothetical protein